MQKIKELIKTTLEKGFATEDERVLIQEEFATLDKNQIKVVKEDLEKVGALPFEKIVVANKEDKKEEGKEENQPTKTRAERRAEARAVKGK